jgi:5,10-methylenetetrahydrofolate reductase
MDQVLFTCLQVAAGAQVILTQPPLDWPAFERWIEDARQRGLHEAARLLIGFPCLSSASNCGFWLALCGAGSNAEVR